MIPTLIVLIKFYDCQHLTLILVPAGSVLWVREEALASVVAVELIDLPVSDIEVAIEKEFNIKDGKSNVARN